MRPDSTVADIFPLTPLPAIQASPTPSPTASVTASPTPTHWINGAPASESNTCTPTPSTTMTLSGSATATESSFPSLSATESAYPSTSATTSVSASESAYPSTSSSASVSATESAIPSTSSSGSASPSASSSASVSATETSFATISPTPSASSSGSATRSSLPTETASRSSLPSSSPQSTATTSTSATGSASGSPSSTNTKTATRTSTPTPSVTPSTLPNMGCSLCGAGNVKSLDLNPSNGNVYFNDYYLRLVNRITPSTPKDPFITIPSNRQVPAYLAAHPTDSNILYLNEDYYGNIFKYDISQGTFTTIINSGTITNPRWMRADSSGNLYIAMIGPTTNSAGIKKWTASNNGISDLVTGLSTSTYTGISINPSGSIMIYSSGGAIYRYASGSSTQLVSGISTLISIAYDYTGGNVFYSGGDGSLRMYTIANSQVTNLIPASGVSMTVFAIITDATGNIIYFSDQNTNTINRYIRSTGQLTRVAGNGLSYPSNYAYNPVTGAFYIGDASGSKIHYWDGINYPTTLLSGLSGFMAMAVDPNNLEMIYICESNTGYITAVNATSRSVQFKLFYSGYWTVACRFNPYDGKLYFGDSQTGKIYKYTPSTGVTNLVGTASNINIRDMAIDKYSNMYFVSYAGTIMLRMAANGTITRYWTNSNVKMMIYSHQVSSDGSTLYISTDDSRTILKYVIATDTITTLTTPALTGQVYKLELVNDRLLYILDYGRLDILVVPIY